VGIRDLTVERTAFVIRVLLYLVFGALLAAVNLLFDYAKVRAVVEDRRSMIGALVSAARFAARRPGRVAGLYLLTGVLYFAVVALYACSRPGRPQAAGSWSAACSSARRTWPPGCG